MIDNIADKHAKEIVCSVAGVSHANYGGTSRRSIIREHVQPGIELDIKREYDNPADDNAISLWVTGDGRQQRIGYVPKKFARDIAPRIDSGEEAIRVTVREVIHWPALSTVKIAIEVVNGAAADK
jgi:hypothetical protein